MNRFIIVDGLPYLYADGKAYSVRWDEKGFTVGAEVKLASVPAYTYSEISILAKCHECLNSIDPIEPENQGNDTDTQGQNDTDNKQAENQEEDPDAEGQKEQAEGEKEENTEPPALEEMTVAKLKDYAAEKGIDLGKATKKADIIAAINAAE